MRSQRGSADESKKSKTNNKKKPITHWYGREWRTLSVGAIHVYLSDWGYLPLWPSCLWVRNYLRQTSEHDIDIFLVYNWTIQFDVSIKNVIRITFVLWNRY